MSRTDSRPRSACVPARSHSSGVSACHSARFAARSAPEERKRHLGFDLCVTTDHSPRILIECLNCDFRFRQNQADPVRANEVIVGEMGRNLWMDHFPGRWSTRERLYQRFGLGEQPTHPERQSTEQAPRVLEPY
jgi:hypothetical protein